MSEIKEPNLSLVDRDIYDDIMSGTNIISGDEFKTIMCTIAQFCSDVVVKTLGPYGSTTLLDDGQGFIYPTKDGWSALNKIKFSDPIYNTALNTLRKTSFDAVTGAGDGTTTAMVAANAFLQYVMNSNIIREEGFNQALFRKKVEDAANDIIKKLYERATPVTHDHQGVDIIRQIATIATNGNEYFGDIIAKIYEKTFNPDIHVRIGDQGVTTYDIQEGYRVEAYTLGFPAFVNADGERCIEKDLKVIVFNHNVTFTDDWNFLQDVIMYCNEHKCKLVILAPYFDDMITNWYSRNVAKSQQQGTVPMIMLCQIPATTNLQKAAITDLEILTNAAVVDGEMIAMFDALKKFQIDPENAKVDQRILKMAQELYQYPMQIIETAMGTAGKLEFTAKQFFLLDYEKYANMPKLEEAQKRAGEEWDKLRKSSNRTASSNLTKQYMEAHQRYIRLMGKMGSIVVGGATDLQKICDKDAIDDACLACRSAWDAGYVSGMNLDTIREINSTRAYLLHMVEEDPSCAMTDGTRYYLFALDALFQAFATVAKAVLDNKCGPTSEQQVMFEDNSIAYMTNTQILQLLVYGHTKWESKSHQILSATDSTTTTSEPHAVDIKCALEGPERYSYDLRNGYMHRMESHHAIINSVEMDVQIIRSMVAVLTLVITSSQFLSTARMYDRKLTAGQQHQKTYEDYFRRGTALMSGILNAIVKDEPKGTERLAEIISGVKALPLEFGESTASLGFSKYSGTLEQTSEGM